MQGSERLCCEQMCQFEGNEQLLSLGDLIVLPFCCPLQRNPGRQRPQTCVQRVFSEVHLESVSLLKELQVQVWCLVRLIPRQVCSRWVCPGLGDGPWRPSTSLEPSHAESLHKTLTVFTVEHSEPPLLVRNYFSCASHVIQQKVPLLQDKDLQPRNGLFTNLRGTVSRFHFLVAKGLDARIQRHHQCSQTC